MNKKEATIHNGIFSYVLVIKGSKWVNDAVIPFSGGLNADLLEDILKENGYVIKRTGDGHTVYQEDRRRQEGATMQISISREDYIDTDPYRDRKKEIEDRIAEQEFRDDARHEDELIGKE